MTVDDDGVSPSLIAKTAKSRRTYGVCPELPHMSTLLYIQDAAEDSAVKEFEGRVKDTAK